MTLVGIFQRLPGFGTDPGIIIAGKLTAERLTFHRAKVRYSGRIEQSFGVQAVGQAEALIVTLSGALIPGNLPTGETGLNFNSRVNHDFKGKSWNRSRAYDRSNQE